MEKINGRKGPAELHKALGNKTILGCQGVADYAITIAKMDMDDLYRHGMKQYNIRPSNRKNGRATFEKRCVAEFRKETGAFSRTNTAKMPKKKADREKLQAILDKAK